MLSAIVVCMACLAAEPGAPMSRRRTLARQKTQAISSRRHGIDANAIMKGNAGRRLLSSRVSAVTSSQCSRSANAT